MASMHTAPMAPTFAMSHFSFAVAAAAPCSGGKQPLGFNFSQHSPTTRPYVERTVVSLKSFRFSPLPPYADTETDSAGRLFCFSSIKPKVPKDPPVIVQCSDQMAHLPVLF